MDLVERMMGFLQSRNFELYNIKKDGVFGVCRLLSYLTLPYLLVEMYLVSKGYLVSEEEGGSRGRAIGLSRVCMGFMLLLWAALLSVSI